MCIPPVDLAGGAGVSTRNTSLGKLGHDGGDRRFQIERPRSVEIMAMVVVATALETEARSKNAALVT